MNAPKSLLGGKTMVLGGDFQTLPVKKGTGKEELIAASIAESYLWWHFKICTLKENMRLLRSGLNDDQRSQSKFPNGFLMQSEKMSNTTIASLKAGQENCIVEARVYQKWISKSITDMKLLAFCCIQIEKQNNANMDINNIDYFNPLLKPGTVYRFSNFICETTKPYHQTLENNVSLKFGKITRFDILTGKEFEFLEHHFEFIAYNPLVSKVPYQDENSKMIYPVLINAIRSLSANCNILLEPSLRRHLRQHDVLTATPATHYYINPRIPEAEYAHTTFKEKYSLNPPLQISEYRFEDPEQGNTRNKQMLHTLEYILRVRLQSQLLEKIEIGTTHCVANAARVQHNKMGLTLVKTTKNKTRLPTEIERNKSKAATH
ncbi:DNA helicase [Tanacetum coccineum]